MMDHPGLTIASSCISARLRLVNRAVTSIYDQELRPHGLKTSQMNVLVAVAVLDHPEPGEIARLLHIAPSTLSRGLERLRKAGWLDIAAGKDGRSQTLAVTPAGLDLLEAAQPAWEQAQREATALLGQEMTKAVATVGNRLLAAGRVDQPTGRRLPDTREERP